MHPVTEPSKNGGAAHTLQSLLHFLTGLMFCVVGDASGKSDDRPRRNAANALNRSEIMARVRSHGNSSTELRLIRLLRRHRVTGWRRQYPLFGNPDFVFLRARLAVFVDGSFWHGHPKFCRLPASNRRYWLPKIQRNRARDRQVGRTLRIRGWRVVRIWEHELRAKGDACVKRIQRFL
jgi:DNA mismatch endonuclease (patch repair protein)